MRKGWNAVCHVLKSRRGEGYVDAAVFMLLTGMTLALAVSVFGVNWRKTTAQDYADYAARQISADGAFSGATVQKLAGVAGSGHFSIEGKTDDGSDVAVPVTTSSSFSTKEIQEGTAFSVYLTSLDRNTIGVGGLKTNSVTIYGAANGVSQHYWKG
ncbi:MAG: DUF4320 family protein [Ethanoligenens sp.]